MCLCVNKDELADTRDCGLGDAGLTDSNGLADVEIADTGTTGVNNGVNNDELADTRDVCGLDFQVGDK